MYLYLKESMFKERFSIKGRWDWYNSYLCTVCAVKTEWWYVVCEANERPEPTTGGSTRQCNKPSRGTVHWQHKATSTHKLLFFRYRVNMPVCSAEGGCMWDWPKPTRGPLFIRERDVIQCVCIYFFLDKMGVCSTDLRSDQGSQHIADPAVFWEETTNFSEICVCVRGNK